MTILFITVLICGAWAVVASILIARDLQKRGIPVSFFWLRIMILKYLGQYSKITQEENGRIGPLFFHYIVPLNIALVLALVIAIMALL